MRFWIFKTSTRSSYSHILGSYEKLCRLKEKEIHLAHARNRGIKGTVILKDTKAKKMNGRDRTNRMWKTMKQRLIFKGLSCCGSQRSLRVADISDRIEAAASEAQNQAEAQEFSRNDDELEPMIPNMGQPPRAQSVNLAMLLAAERHLRKGSSKDLKKPLMRLFEAMDGLDSKPTKSYEGVDGLCCVCTKRSKGSAFIPCGHTYCRVCSREMWSNRMLCPLCNRPINQILDIF